MYTDIIDVIETRFQRAHKLFQESTDLGDSYYFQGQAAAYMAVLGLLRALQEGSTDERGEEDRT
jgi:hypothetical protein